MTDANDLHPPKRRRIAVAGIAVASLAAAMLLIVATAPAQPGVQLSGSVALSGSNLDGGTLTIPLRGRITVVNVWASWCLPCLTEAPVLRRAWEAELHDGDPAFVGVNVKDTRVDAAAFGTAHGLTYPTLFDPSGELSARLGARLPTTLVLAADGKIVLRHFGPIDEMTLNAAIEQARSAA